MILCFTHRNFMSLQCIVLMGGAYTRCFIKTGPLFVFFIIYSNDDQFTQTFLPLVAEEVLIQNIATKCGR